MRKSKSTEESATIIVCPAEETQLAVIPAAELAVIQPTEEEIPDEQYEPDYCEYCGQILGLTGKCNCADSQTAAKMAQAREAAHKQVNDLFLTGTASGFETNVSEDILKLLYQSVDAVADLLISKAVINITQFSQAVICTDSKDLIKVQRKDVKEVTLVQQV